MVQKQEKSINKGVKIGTQQEEKLNLERERGERGGKIWSTDRSTDHWKQQGWGEPRFGGFTVE